jgi:general secretion pathway protein J
MRRALHRRRGFTLLEVVVALGVLALIASLTFESISNALATRDQLELDDAVNQGARIAMSRLRRDFSLAYLTQHTDAVNTYRTEFVGKDDGDRDAAWLTTLSHQRLYRDSRECDQTEITYWTEPDPNENDAYVLLRREAPRIDQEPERDGTVYPLAYKVKTFNLRYLDSRTGEWKEEWNTGGTETPNKLPRAVQVTLTMLAPDPEDSEKNVERSFLTTIMLEFADPLQQSQTGIP